VWFYSSYVAYFETRYYLLYSNCFHIGSLLLISIDVVLNVHSVYSDVDAYILVCNSCAIILAVHK